MCGIATLTRKVVDQVVGLNTKIIDTRKTTPGIRFLEKLAVQIGGGENHRFGLYDMMMIKDNHIDYAGGIEEAITMADEYRKNQGLGIKLEIEARNLEEVDEILRVGLIDRIMLDNFSFEDMRTAVAKISGSIETEASGGITIDNVRQYAECGVDFVSMGALTHRVSSLDISLKAY
jgi:nicotinate-nucleotide pyrophosphorylase (carboxylating)